MEKMNTYNDKLPISFASFLMLGVVPKLMEKDLLGRMYIRLGSVLTLSIWLYETGAILGRFFKDKLPTLVGMFEIESKEHEFTEFWRSQAKKRLEIYSGQPTSFAIFVGQTDLEMFTGKKLKDLMKIGGKKLYHEEGQRWLRLAETSMIEGIMFGNMFSDLTNEMLINEYEKVDMGSWSEARRYGVTLPEKPSHMSVRSKEQEVMGLLRDYVKEYHPKFIDDLGLT
jgi:hypothetical protein